MTVIRTTAGATHYDQLEAGGALDEIYGTLLFGRGNNEPADGDTVGDVDDIIQTTPQVSPVKGDTDRRNPGRGADVYTWAFAIAPQEEPWVASNVALAPNDAGLTDELAVHGLVTTWSEPYRVLRVWVNLGPTAATIFSAYAEDPIEAARIRSTGARADVLFGGLGAQNLRVGEVYSQVRAGESVSLRGQLYGESGMRLTPDQVLGVRRQVAVYDADRDTYVTSINQYLDRCLIEGASFESTALFPYRGGYNFEAILPGKFTRPGKDLRLTYSLELSDGNIRVFRQTVRVQPT